MLLHNFVSFILFNCFLDGLHGVIIYHSPHTSNTANLSQYPFDNLIPAPIFHQPLINYTHGSSSTLTIITTTTTKKPNNNRDESYARQYRAYEKRYRNCPSLRNALPNGYVKIRSYPNRLARFYCNDGYELFGNKYSTCSRNRWTHDLPICVSSKCPLKAPVQPPMSIKKTYNQGSVLDLSCDLGYELRLSKNNTISSARNLTNFMNYLSHTLRIYCVGRKWMIDDWKSDPFSSANVNYRRIPLQSFPECEIYDKPVNGSMKCDFEESICGWFQDDEDDFDWTRNSLTTPSHYDDTGPSYDHTLGPDHSGYYLYLESSYPRSPNEIARLYSPVYQHTDTYVACFQFYYHMYGKNIGSLRVYLKEKSDIFSELNPSWELTGDQGDQWQLGQVEIEDRTEFLRPFQIIIEGVLGYGHRGDIAIDDLSLTLGKRCSELTKIPNTDVSVEVDPNVIDLETPDATDNNTSINDSNLEGWITSANVTSSYTDTFGTNASVDHNPSDIFNDIVRSIIHFKPHKSFSNTNDTHSSHQPYDFLFPRPKTSTMANLDIVTSAPTTITTSTTIKSFDESKNSSLHSYFNGKLSPQIQPENDKHSTKSNNNSVPITSYPSSKATPQAEMVSISPLPSIIINTTTTTTITTTTSENDLAIHELPVEERLKTQDDNGLINKSSFRINWLNIFVSLSCLLIILAAIIYVVYVNWPIHRLPDYRFVAIFVNRCKVFQRNNQDDSEMLMVHNNDNHPSISNNRNNGNFYDNDLLIDGHISDDVVYLQHN